MKLSDLKPNPRNPRKISEAKLGMLKKSLDEFGDLSGFIWNTRTRMLSGGHQRGKVLPPDSEVWMEEKFLTPTRTGTVGHGYVVHDGEKYACRFVDWDTQKEKAANIAANKHGGDFDLPGLAEWLLELDSANYDMDLTGFDRDELENLMAPFRDMPGEGDGTTPPTMADKFLIPPFSVFNAREGWWQNRKAAWIALGIQSELGRGDAKPPGGGQDPLLITAQDKEETAQGAGRRAQGAGRRKK